MKFDFNKFTKELHQEYQDELSYEEVERLLDIKAQYDLGDPISHGKKLLIDRISFYGEKKLKIPFHTLENRLLILKN